MCIYHYVDKALAQMYLHMQNADHVCILVQIGHKKVNFTLAVILTLYTGVIYRE